MPPCAVGAPRRRRRRRRRPRGSLRAWSVRRLRHSLGPLGAWLAANGLASPGGGSWRPDRAAVFACVWHAPLPPGRRRPRRRRDVRPSPPRRSHRVRAPAPCRPQSVRGHPDSRSAPASRRGTWAAKSPNAGRVLMAGSKRSTSRIRVVSSPRPKLSRDIWSGEKSARPALRNELASRPLPQTTGRVGRPAIGRAWVTVITPSPATLTMPAALGLVRRPSSRGWHRPRGRTAGGRRSRTAPG